MSSSAPRSQVRAQPGRQDVAGQSGQHVAEPQKPSSPGEAPGGVGWGRWRPGLPDVSAETAIAPTVHSPMETEHLLCACAWARGVSRDHAPLSGSRPPGEADHGVHRPRMSARRTCARWPEAAGRELRGAQPWPWLPAEVPGGARPGGRGNTPAPARGQQCKDHPRPEPPTPGTSPPQGPWRLEGREER